MPQVAVRVRKVITEHPKASYESRYDSEGFDSLDAKLAMALASITSGSLAQQFVLLSEQESNRGRMLKGRQMLWMSHDYRKLDEERGAMYDYNDLATGKLRGDSRLETFINVRDSVIACMKTDPGPRFVEIWF